MPAVADHGWSVADCKSSQRKASVAAARAVQGTFLLVCSALAGCDWVDRVRLSPDERIGRASPVPMSVTYAVTQARELIKGDPKVLADFNGEYARQLRVRSVECAKGYAPSFTDSEEAIRQKLDPPCLQRHDESLARWAGLWRAGVIAAMPPLRPVPTTHVPSLTLPSEIGNVWFAERSATALIQHRRSASLVDLGSGRILYTMEARDRQGYGPLSPNGRLFTWSDGERITLRLSEGGDTVVDLPQGHPTALQWLQSGGLLHGGSSPQSMQVTDLKRREQYSSAISGYGLLAFDSPDSTTESVLVQYSRMARVKLAEPPDAPGLLTLAESHLPPAIFSGTGARTADRRYFVDAFHGRSLLLYDLSLLERREIAMNPLVIEGVAPTADADRILLSGYIGKVDHRSAFLYSISQGTLAEIDAGARSARFFRFATPIGKLAAIAGAQMLFLDDVAAGAPRRLDEYSADEIAAANQRKLEAFAKTLDTVPPQDAAIVAQKMQPSGPLAGITPEPGSISRLARDAVVEAVGVYQGKSGPGRGTSGNPVEIRVRRSSRPLVLVLTAYERVHWNLVLEPGAQLVAVLTSGYYDQIVSNAGGARVFAIGSTYVYERSNLAPLEQDVFRATGKPISVFQGRYEGGTFTVGGG